jgi:hypothetical protein
MGDKYGALQTNARVRDEVQRNEVEGWWGRNGEMIHRRKGGIKSSHESDDFIHMT